MSQGHTTQLLKHGKAAITPGLRLHCAIAADRTSDFEWEVLVRMLVRI